MTHAKLTQQLKDLRQLKKNVKVMQRVYKTNLELAKRIDTTPDEYTMWIHFEEYNPKPALNHIDMCIKSVREALKEIKLRRK